MKTNENSISHDNRAPCSWLSFQIKNETYAVDLLKVQEIFSYHKTTPLAGSPASVRGVLNLRGEIVTIVDLAMALGLPACVENPQSVFIILNLESCAAGLLVDQVFDVIENPGANLLQTPAIANSLTSNFYGIISSSDQSVIALDIEKLLLSGPDAIFSR